MTSPEDDEPVPAGPQRIAKVIARAGLCSRREAEAWVAAGRVAVDGTVVTSPATTVTERQVVAVDGKPLPAPAPVRLWRYHKPPGLVTTARDPQGRPTVFDRLPKAMPRVISIGRLDLNSEGLLLLTNDGGLARRLELPATGWRRRYRVRVHGRVEQTALDRLKDGVTVSGERYGPIEAVLERQTGSNAWLMVTLAEGRNREVRRVMEHLGYRVNRLVRIGYGPFVLGKLPRGAVEEVSPAGVRQALGKPPHKGAKAKPRKPSPGRRGRERRAAGGPGKGDADRRGGA